MRTVLFPPVCMVCGQDGRPEIDCCSGCEADLPMLAGQCARCGLEMEHDVALCGRCAMALPAFQGTWPGFSYQGVIERLITRFKFHGDLAAGRLLADLLARRLVELGAPRPDLMVPVPLHVRRRLQRGFNQSALICRDLSAWFGRLPWSDSLRRHRATAQQSDLPADQRTGNVRGAFGLDRLPPGVRHVALVDDVMTTGSTLNECARVLLQAGVERVDVWVVARA
ncbi:MAG: ComF family protein [Wenzhouxiangella sp.]|nr:MAG: ComF family protein [Wenzhouxiangella sp.]